MIMCKNTANLRNGSMSLSNELNATEHVLFTLLYTKECHGLEVAKEKAARDAYAERGTKTVELLGVKCVIKHVERRFFNIG